MKLFLTKFRSCWQSTHHNSISESDQSENALMNPQPIKRRSSSVNWRPALTAISEDNCAAAFVVCSDGNEDELIRRKTRLIDKEKLRPPKAVRDRVKSGRYAGDIESSWKVQAQMAIPAFSPAPFMF